MAEAEEAVSVKLRLRIPSVPNFIMTQVQPVKGEVKFSIEEMSDDELRQIGAAWTEKLIRRAKEIRSYPKAAPNDE